MKKILFVGLILIVYCTLYIENCFSQSGWYQVTTPITDLYLNDIQFTSANTGYAIGPIQSSNRGYILKTTNGGFNWQSIYIDSLWCWTLYFLDDNTGYIDGGYDLGVIKKTTNGGLNWVTQTTNLANCFFCIYFVDYNTGYAGGKYDAVAKTTNGGINWFLVSPVLGAFYVQDVYFFNASTGIVVGGNIYKTTNGGNNWNVCSFSNNDYRSLYFANNYTGYVCGYWGGVIFKTTDAGENWNFLDSLGSGLNNIYFVNPAEGYACPGNHSIFKTTDGGYNWSQQFTSNLYYFESIYFLNSLTGFIAGNNGIIMKTTNGGNVFIGNNNNNIPDNYALYQNYPNPFNPITKIKFDVANPPLTKGGQGGLITLKIYDITGRKIQTFVNEKLNQGTYEVSFDGSNLASGIYFYQLKVGNNILDVKKMVLLK